MVTETVETGAGAEPVSWETRMQAKRASLVVEQGKAVRALRAAEQQVGEMQALIQRLSGAIRVIDELVNPLQAE